VYTETVVIDKSLTIVADPVGATVELTASQGPALLARSGAAVVRGLTIRGADPTAVAVAIEGGALHMEECDISHGRVEAGGWAEPQFVRCRIHDCGGPALHASGDAQASLTRCAVEDIEGTGLLFSQASRGTVAGTTVTRVTGTGAHLRDTATCLFDDSAISETGRYGVLTEGPPALVMRRTRLRDTGDDGVRIDGSSRREPSSGSAGDAPDAGPPRGVELAECTVTRAGGNGLVVNGADVLTRNCQVRAPRSVCWAAAPASSVWPTARWSGA
jgi:hypothetical protein